MAFSRRYSGRLAGDRPVHLFVSVMSLASAPFRAARRGTSRRASVRKMEGTKMRYAMILIVAALLAACQAGHPDHADSYRGGHGHYHVD